MTKVHNCRIILLTNILMLYIWIEVRIFLYTGRTYIWIVLFFFCRKSGCSPCFHSTGLGCCYTVFHVGSYRGIGPIDFTVWSITQLQEHDNRRRCIVPWNVHSILFSTIPAWVKSYTAQLSGSLCGSVKWAIPFRT